jgi:hypothetical protein
VAVDNSLDSLDDAEVAADASDCWQPAWLATARQHDHGQTLPQTGSQQRQSSGSERTDQQKRGAGVCSPAQNPQADRLPTANAQCQTPCHAHVQTDAIALPDARLAPGSSSPLEQAHGLVAPGDAQPKPEPQQMPATAGGAANAAALQHTTQPGVTCYRVTIWTANMPGCYTEGRPHIIIYGADGSRYTRPTDDDPPILF